MTIQVEITEAELRKLVKEHLQSQVGVGFDFKEADIKILVKTSRNFKADWEPGQFKASINILRV